MTEPILPQRGRLKLSLIANSRFRIHERTKIGRTGYEEKHHCRAFQQVLSGEIWKKLPDSIKQKGRTKT